MKAPVLLSGHSLQLLQRGAAFFPALIAAVDGSSQEVRLETYIFEFDASGALVAAALERAALRGVHVYVVMDGVGTPHVPPQWVQRFDTAGVRWHRFSPMGRLGYFVPSRWRRMHRKLCVVDGYVALVGGINILDDYADPNHGPQASPRFDFATRIEGPLVADARHAMVQFWDRLQVTRQQEKLDLRAAQHTWSDMHKRNDVAQPTKSVAGSGALAALVLRDNLRNRTRIERTYRKAIAAATQEVIISNAYFLPGGKLRRAIIHAVRRGVRVRLLLPGKYEYFIQYHGCHPVYRALLAVGVEIYEYSAGFLHAKVAVIDGQWATVGSSNLDPLSLLLAREANVVVQDTQFAQELRGKLVEAMETQGNKLDMKMYAARPWRNRILEWLAYGVMRTTLFLTGRRY